MITAITILTAPVSVPTLLVAAGGQDVVFGALGSDTSSVNVVRDFGYGGDEAAYNQAKGIVTTTAAVGTMVLAPVAQTVSAASGGMKSGKTDSTKQTKTTSNTGATSGKTATAGNSGKSTTSALKLKSGETDAVGQTKTAGNAGTRGNPNPNIKPKKFYRSMSQRRKALLRDADDPNSGLSQEAKDFIKKTDGKKVPEGYEVAHKKPLYTKKDIDGKKELDKADNMNTIPKKVHRDSHKTCGSTFHDYPR